MRANHYWALLGALALGVFPLLQNRVFAKPTDEHKPEREAISSVLNAQQTAWNRGDVEAFLVGYWHSPELTFSGSSEWHAVGMASGRAIRRIIPTKLRWGSWIFRNWSFGFWARMQPWCWESGI